MTTSSFTVNNANTLSDIIMIAGDEQELIYNVYDSNGALLLLGASVCTVNIFPYGDPTYNVVTLSGVVAASPDGQFTATFESADSASLSGVYQQQVTIVDYLGKVHIPSQGKITIFPAP